MNEFTQKIDTHFMLSNGKSYKCLITPPCIEYSIPRENFTFIKYVNLNEMNEYISCAFKDWSLIALQQLMSYSQFNQ